VKVVGLDLSLTGAGVAVLDGGDVTVRTIKSKTAGTRIEDRYARLDGMRLEIEGVLGFARLAVIEQPAYSQTNGHSHDRSGLWWFVVETARKLGATVVEVSPTTVKKYATGTGSADKDAMVWTTAREWPGLERLDNNGCDALWLAAMGRAHLDPDTALHSVTKARAATLKAVAW
jgi:Holliday junction resolvasome RuvABC endonuclease subunit